MDRKKNSISKEKTALYLFVVFTLLASTFQMLTLSKFNFDEYFTVNLVRNSWADVIRFTALDVHPPLYYLFQKLAVTIFGDNFLAWHLISFCSFLALLIMTERFVSVRFGDKEAALAVLALCSVPGMLRYCLQVRMYSMAMLWVTAAFFLTWMLIEQYTAKGMDGQPADKKKARKYWILLAIVNVAAAYTHYFAGVAAVGLSLYLLICLLCIRRGNKKNALEILGVWCLYSLGMAVLYLPWMFVMLGQMADINGNYWIARISIESLYGYFSILFGDTSGYLGKGLAVIFFLGCYFLFVQRKGGRDRFKWGSFFAAGFLVTFGVGYSVLRTPILIDRYLVIVVPMLWISIVLTLLERKGKWIEAGLVILLCLCFIDNQQALYREYDAVENSEETSCLLDNVKENDLIYHTNAQRLAERAAFLPDARHLLLEGCDDGEAFHYWSEMIGCTVVKDENEVLRIAEESAEGIEMPDIWCEDDSCLEAFEKAGWQVEEYPAWSVVFYRIYQP